VRVSCASVIGLMVVSSFKHWQNIVSKSMNWLATYRPVVASAYTLASLTDLPTVPHKLGKIIRTRSWIVHVSDGDLLRSKFSEIDMYFTAWKNLN